MTSFLALNSNRKTQRFERRGPDERYIAYALMSVGPMRRLGEAMLP